jgi:hypothetical protein
MGERAAFGEACVCARTFVCVCTKGRAA